MKTNFKFLRFIGLSVLLAMTLYSCDSDDDGTTIVTGLTVQTNNSGLGLILTNQDNRTMYFSAGDVTGESNCNGGCAQVWPAVPGDLYDLEFGSGLNTADFSTITGQESQKQLTYKGWPLYYFSENGDGVLEAPGQTLGDGRGGLFHVAKPDYTLLPGRQAIAGEEDVLYLVDDRGVSLYQNTADDFNVSNCNGGCAGVWPPFDKVNNLVLPSSLNASDFYSVTRDDELGPQLSFEGSPLYFFSQDEGKRASVLGQAGGPNQTFFVKEALN